MHRPAFVIEALRQNLGKLDSYPATAGLPETRAACAALAGSAVSACASTRTPWCCR